MDRQKGLVPVLIIILIAAGISGYFVYTNSQTKTPTPTSQPSPSPSDASPVPTGATETANWKTYTSLTMAFELRYPHGEIIEDSIPIPNNGLQTTIKLNNANILIIKRPNINPVTNLPYKTLTEFDLRTSNFSSITLGGMDAKDSGEYGTQSGTIQRDVMLIQKADIWIIQAVKLDQNIIIPLDQILSTFKFTE